MDGLDSSSNFQFLQSFVQTFGNHPKLTSYSWYHRLSHVLLYFLGLWLDPSMWQSFCYNFALWSTGMAKSIRWHVLISFNQHKVWFSCKRCVIPLCLKTERIIPISFSGTDFGFCIYHLIKWSILISCIIPRRPLLSLSDI